MSRGGHSFIRFNSTGLLLFAHGLSRHLFVSHTHKIAIQAISTASSEASLELHITESHLRPESSKRDKHAHPRVLLTAQTRWHACKQVEPILVSFFKNR